MMHTASSPARRQIPIAVLICLLLAAAWRMVPMPVFSIGLALAPLAVIFVLRAPFVVVLGFVLFSFFRIHEAYRWLGPLHLPQLLALSSFAVLGWHLVLSKKIELYWAPQLTLFAVFFALVTIGVPLASNPAEAMPFWSGTFVKIGVMVLAIAWLTREQKDFHLALRMIVLAGISIAWVALYNKAHGIGMVEETRVTIARDLGSMIGDPNDLSLVLLFPSGFAMALLMTRGLPWYDRLLGLVGIGMLISAILATQSRGGILGIAGVLGIFSYRRIKNKALFFMLAGLFFLVMFAAAGISGRSSGGAGESGVDESSMGRIYAWGAAWRMALRNPLTGVGINNFVVNYFFYSEHWDGRNHAVHSTWFGVLAETGFPGLIVFVSMIVSDLKLIIRSVLYLDRLGDTVHPSIHAGAQAVMAALIGTMISGTFLTQGFIWPFYILTALVVAVGHYVMVMQAEEVARNEASDEQ